MESFGEKFQGKKGVEETAQCEKKQNIHCSNRGREGKEWGKDGMVHVCRTSRNLRE